MLKRNYAKVRVGKEVTTVHRALVEKLLGRKLPDEAVVHHIDDDETNNVNENLVVCPNQAYHALLHKRMRALAAAGNADYEMCHICKQYDAPESLSKQSSGEGRSVRFYHSNCRADYLRKLYYRRES